MIWICCAKRVDKEELSQSQQAGFIYLILYTVSGFPARTIRQTTAMLILADGGFRPRRFRKGRLCSHRTS